MSLRQALLATCLVCLPFAATAANDAPDPFHVSATLGFASQYVFRGITQSDEDPVIQGSFDVTHDSGLYAGVWGSNVDFNDGDQAHLETDLYAGYKTDVKGFTLDVGLIGYLYPGANTNLNYNYFEGKFAVSRDLKFASMTASVNYSPDYFAGSGHAVYGALAVTAPVYKGLGFAGSVGHQTIDKPDVFGVPGYTDWSAGLTYNLYGFDLSAKYTDTSISKNDCPKGCNERGVFAISRTF